MSDEKKSQNTSGKMRAKIEEAIAELDTDEKRFEYLIAELASARCEKSGRDRRIQELQDQLEATPSSSSTDEEIAAIRDLAAKLKAREGLVELREHALERCEAEGVPLTLGLRLAMKDLETTDRNIDDMVKWGDGIVDKTLANAWKQGPGILGDKPVQHPSRRMKGLQGKPGRSLKVDELSADEFGRIPRSLRDSLGEEMLK